MGYDCEKPALQSLPQQGFLDLAMTVLSLSMGLSVIVGVVGLTNIGLVETKSLTMTVALLAPCITMVQYVAPAPVVLDAARNMSAGSLWAAMFQLQAGANILGMAYGIQTTNSAVLTPNMFGLGCQILYLSADEYIRLPNTNWLRFSFRLSTLLNCSLFVFAAVPLSLLGHGITVINICLSALPLLKLGVILRTRVSSYPLLLVSIAMVNNATWTIYGLLIMDSVLLVPSVLGYLINIFQILVILWCRGALPFDLLFLQSICRLHREAQKQERGISISVNDAEIVDAQGEDESDLSKRSSVGR